MSDKRKQIGATIRVLDIKKSDLAEMIADGQPYSFKPSQVTDYLRGRPLNGAKAARLEKTVEDVARVWMALGIRTDLSDIEGFNRLLAHVNQTLASESLAADTERLSTEFDLVFGAKSFS